MPEGDEWARCQSCGAPMMPQEAFSNGSRACEGCASIERMREEERLDTKECPKCFRKTRGWGRKAWRDGREYCKECEKGLERVWFIANSCMLCNRLISEGAERISPPKSMQERDPYVKNFVVGERAVCWECYVKETKRPFGVKLCRKRTR